MACMRIAKDAYIAEEHLRYEDDAPSWGDGFEGSNKPKWVIAMATDTDQPFILLVLVKLFVSG